MRKGLFEVFLVYEDNEFFPETTIDGKTYFHAEPNRHYYVKINVHRDPITNAFPAKYLRIGLYVDGNDVQYWKRLDLTNLENNEQYAPSSSSSSTSSSISSIATKGSIQMTTSHFYGFKKNCDEIISFKAVLPSTVSSARSILNAKDLENSLGTIRVVIFEARVTGGTYQNKSGYHEIPRDHAVLAEQKFWKQASVATTGGRKIDSEKEKFLPLVRWENVSKTPMETIEAFYHTPQTILVLKNIHEDQLQQRSLSRKEKRSLSANDDDNEKNKFPRHGEPIEPVKNEDDSDNESVATVEDVTLVVKEQIIPFLDLSCDDDEKLEWQSVVIKK